MSKSPARRQGQGLTYLSVNVPPQEVTRQEVDGPVASQRTLRQPNGTREQTTR